VTTRAPKTRTAPVPAPAETDGVLRLSTSSATPVEEAREPLFYIDGEEFTVPKVISPRIVYLGINKMRAEGMLFGSMYVTELILGTDQYQRLLAHYEAERITQEQFDQVGKLINGLFFDQDRRAATGEEDTGKASGSSHDS
jgi:hypothetical protein